MSEQPELLPCPNPWCDGKRFIKWDLYSKHVQCSCGVKGPLSETTVIHIPAERSVEVTRKIELEAITAWNTRAQLSEPVKVKPDADLIQQARAEAYAEALEAAALMFIEERDYDWSGIQYAQDVGIPISNADDLQKSADRADKNARDILALPNPYKG